MSSEQLQALVAILLLNAIAWGGYVTLQNEPETVYLYHESLAESANVTVSLDFGEAGANATTFTNATTVSFGGIIVVNDTSAYAATIAAARAQDFAVGVTLYSFGTPLTVSRATAATTGCSTVMTPIR